jgi:hypothetical protein
MIGVVAVAVATPTTALAETEHQGTNRLVFAPVAGSPSPRASGSGIVEFGGGVEPRSKWSSTFRFAGLKPDTDYTVVVKGRRGLDGSAEAAAFTGLCSFRTDSAGAGGCWWYFRGLARLDVVQLRRGGVTGTPVVQASSYEPGPGSISREPNRYSPNALPQRARKTRG